MSPAHAPRLATAPGDLLIEISTWLKSRTDLLNFCLTSNHIYTHVSSVLYTKVILASLQQCQVTLEMLHRRPDIARHVRHLVVNPKSSSSAPCFIPDNGSVSNAVMKLAGSMRLDALVKFAWEGEEIPHNDDMWFALRMGCPQLRYITTTFGSRLPSINSHLFDFVDLTNFSLLLTPSFYERHQDIFIEDDNPIAYNLWRMLISRCPNLEELCINGTHSSPTDLHMLVQGRWPKLRKLSLGDVSVDWIPGNTNTTKPPFIEFLEAHPHIESLDLSKHTIQPNLLNSLDTSIHRLTNFSGTFAQLQAIPHVHASLKSVSIREPVMTREISALAVAGILQGISSLENLKISFMLHSMYDSGNLLRSLTGACPNLRHLELTCGHKPSFQLESFSRNIRSLSKLRSLRLTIVKYPGDEALSSGAARIAKTNPRLENFTLTILPQSYPLALPFSIPGFPFPFPSCSSGRFVLTCDNHGLPLSLSASEQRGLIWPWGLGTTCRTKKYVRDLRPMGAPGRRKTGVWAVVGLAFERSGAGDEMRIILFCFMMVILAGWGCLGKRTVTSTNATTAAGVMTDVVADGVVQVTTGSTPPIGLCVPSTAEPLTSLDVVTCHTVEG